MNLRIRGDVSGMNKAIADAQDKMKVALDGAIEAEADRLKQEIAPPRTVGDEFEELHRAWAELKAVVWTEVATRLRLVLDWLTRKGRDNAD